MPRLIALKREGALGPRRRAEVAVRGDAATELIVVEAPRTLTLLNFSARAQRFDVPAGWQPLLSTRAADATEPAPGGLAPYEAMILRRA